MIYPRSTKKILGLSIAAITILVLAASCGTGATHTTPPEITETISPILTSTQEAIIPAASPTPQPLSAPVTFGPDQNNFPE